MLLTYPRLKARRLFCEFSRVIGMDNQLSDVPPGADHHDLLNLQNNRMKSIAFERHFYEIRPCISPCGPSFRCLKLLPTILSGYSFFAVEKRVTGSKGLESKTGKDASKRQRMLLWN